MITLVLYEPTNVPHFYLKETQQTHELTELNVLNSTIKTNATNVAVHHLELPVLSGIVKAEEIYNQIISSNATDLVLFICISKSLTDGTLPNGQELSKLVTLLVYESSKIVQFQPLKTGRAHDVTGRMSICNGPKLPDIDPLSYQYFVRGHKHILKNVN